MSIAKHSKIMRSFTHNQTFTYFIYYAGQKDFEGLTVSHRHVGSSESHNITFRYCVCDVWLVWLVVVTKVMLINIIEAMGLPAILCIIIIIILWHNYRSAQLVSLYLPHPNLHFNATVARFAYLTLNGKSISNLYNPR